VTGVDENSKLAALRRARERLELALAADDNWQTLRRSLAAAGSGEASRLETALLSNPLYRAWKNVNAAIEARQRSGPVGTLLASAEPPSSQPPSAAAAAKGRADFSQPSVAECNATVAIGWTTQLGPPQEWAEDVRLARTLPAPSSPAAGGGQMKPATRIVAAATEEEASVSFVARTPALGPSLPAPPHARPGAFAQQLERLAAEQGGDSDHARPAAGQIGDLSHSREAEVSVVSVDARRHAGAVERLLRALRGEKSAQ
jgi:hypothetical protein